MRVPTTESNKNKVSSNGWSCDLIMPPRESLTLMLNKSSSFRQYGFYSINVSVLNIVQTHLIVYLWIKPSKHIVQSTISGI